MAKDAACSTRNVSRFKSEPESEFRAFQLISRTGICYTLSNLQPFKAVIEGFVERILVTQGDVNEFEFYFFSQP